MPTVPPGVGLEVLVTFSMTSVTGLVLLMLRDPMQRLHGVLLGVGAAVLLGGWWSMGHLPLLNALTPHAGYSIILGGFAAAATQLPEIFRPEQGHYERRFSQASKAFYTVTAVVVVATVAQTGFQGHLLPTIALGIPAVGFLVVLYRFLQFESGLDVQLVADEGDGKTMTLLLFRTASEPYVEVPMDSEALGGVLEDESKLGLSDGWPVESNIGNSTTMGYKFDVGKWLRNRIDLSAEDFPGGWLPAIAEYAEWPVWRLRVEVSRLTLQHWVYTSVLASVVGTLPIGPSEGQLENRAIQLERSLGPAACALKQITSDHLFVGLDLEAWLTALSGDPARSTDGHPLPLDALEQIAEAAQDHGSTVHVLGLKADHMEPYWYELCHHNEPLDDELLSTLMEMVDHQAYSKGMIGNDLPEMRRHGVPHPEAEYDVFREMVTVILRQQDERLNAFLKNLNVDIVDPTYVKTTRNDEGEIIPKRRFGKLQPVGHAEVLRELNL
jgi:hypothetical protein